MAKTHTASNGKTYVEGRTIKVYKSYNFKDKDPIIDKARTVVQDSGMTYHDIFVASGVTVGTLHNWFEGGTKRPQFATLNAVARALGKELDFVDKKAARKPRKRRHMRDVRR